MELSVAGCEIDEVEEHVYVHFAINDLLHIKDEDGPRLLVSLVTVDDTLV